MVATIEERATSLEDRVSSLELRSEMLEAKWKAIDLKLDLLLKDKGSMSEHFVHKDIYHADMDILRKDINGVGDRLTKVIQNLRVPSVGLKEKWLKRNYQIILIAIICSVGTFLVLEFMNWMR